MIKDNGVICPMPFMQMSTTANGYYQACCVAKAQLDFTFENTSPMEFFNSDFMKTLRSDMAYGDMSETVCKSCQKCYDQEKLFGRSKRTDALVHPVHSSKKVNEVIDKVKYNPDIDLEPSDIDHLKIKIFGNICNLRCQVCTPYASSALAAEMKKYGLYNGPTLLNSYNSVSKEKLYNDLKIICPVLRQFEIVGGEPLMMDDALEMLEWMVEKDFARNLEFRIITNGTITNYEFLNLMKNFKKATFIVSLDGVGKKEEYIRNRTVWDEKVEVISHIIYAGVDISWSNTIQLLNIGYLDEIQNFYIKLKDKHPNATIAKPHMNNLLMYPRYARSSNIPPKIAEKYLKKHKSLNMNISNLHTHIKSLENASNNDHFIRAMQVYKYFDEKRGTCLLDEWPEFEDYYSNVGPEIYSHRS